MAGNNPPVIIELSPELAEFLVKNCEANISYALNAINVLKSRDLLEKMVEHLENFKKLKLLTEKAMKDS